MLGIRNGTLSMINLKTNEFILDSIPISEPIMEYHMSVDTQPNITLSISDCKFDIETMNTLFGLNQPIHKFDIEAIGTRSVYIQARKHRTKRINKKWLKRYGYKEIQVPVHIKLDECAITTDEDWNGCCSIVGKVGEIK
jgi:hypothetical protein